MTGGEFGGRWNGVSTCEIDVNLWGQRVDCCMLNNKDIHSELVSMLPYMVKGTLQMRLS